MNLQREPVPNVNILSEPVPNMNLLSVPVPYVNLLSEPVHKVNTVYSVILFPTVHFPNTYVVFLLQKCTASFSFAVIQLFGPYLMIAVI